MMGCWLLGGVWAAVGHLNVAVDSLQHTRLSAVQSQCVLLASSWGWEKGTACERHCCSMLHSSTRRVLHVPLCTVLHAAVAAQQHCLTSHGDPLQLVQGDLSVGAGLAPVYGVPVGAEKPGSGSLSTEHAAIAAAVVMVTCR
jgi:hypothetical protein